MDLESGGSRAALLKDDEVSESTRTNDKVVSDSGSGLVSGSVKKGHGLKKWRRIPRDVNKIGTSSSSTGKTGMEEESLDPVANPTKRGSGYAEKQRKSETSLSPRVDPGFTSENGEEQLVNSPPSVTSGLKINYEIPLVVGSSNDKGRMRLSGKNLGKARIQAMKKHRGKESSPVFASGDGPSSNGVKSHFDGENGDEVLGTNDGLDDEGIFHEDEINKPPEVVNIKNKDEDSHEDQDPLAEVMLELQKVQEALGKELLLLSEITKEVVEEESGDGPEQTDVGNQSDEMLKRTIESDVIYTVTTGSAKELTTNISAQATALEKQKNQETSDTLRYDDLGTESMLQTEAVKLEKIESSGAGKNLMQKSFYKVLLCFIIQLSLLLMTIRLPVSRTSSQDGNFIPT